MSDILTRVEEHPFAQYIRILGKGKTGSRSLSLEEAEQAMSLILQEKVSPEQIGAFLMLLRVKEESAEELAGFVKACRSFASAPESLQVDIDWSSYAGKRRFLPYYLLAALCLADNGHRILMHGSRGHTDGRVYSEDALIALGQSVSHNWLEAETALNQNNFTFVPLRVFNPVLQKMMGLRNHFGLRSPVHSLSRLLNPASAPVTLQSIFHPAYAETHQKAAEILGEKSAVVFKGEAGEVERKPDATCDIRWSNAKGLQQEKWSRLQTEKREWEVPDNLDKLRSIWHSDNKQLDDENAAVLGTLAIVIKTLGEAENEQQSMELAAQYWSKRNRSRL